MNKIKKNVPFIEGIRENGPGAYTVRARIRMSSGKVAEKRATVRTVEEGKTKIEELKAALRCQISSMNEKSEEYYRELKNEKE